MNARQSLRIWDIAQIAIGFIGLRFVLLSLSAAVLLSLHGAFALDAQAQAQLLSQNGWFVVTRLGINALAMFLPLWWVLRRRNCWSREQLLLQLPDTRWFIYGGGLTLVVVPLAFGITRWLNRSVTGVTVDTQAQTLQTGLQVSPLLTASVVLLAAFVIPVVEELAFRGVLFPWLTDRWGVVVGVVGSALAFAAVHPELGIAASAFVIGLILALLTWAAKSIWPAVVIHILNNLYGVLSLIQSL